MKPDHDASLRQHLLELLKGGSAHARFEEAIAGIPAKLRGHEAGRISAFPVDAARAHAHRAMGHPRIQPQPKACFPRLAQGLLAAQRSPAQLGCVECQHQEDFART